LANAGACRVTGNRGQHRCLGRAGRHNRQQQQDWHLWGAHGSGYLYGKLPMNGVDGGQGHWMARRAGYPVAPIGRWRAPAQHPTAGVPWMLGRDRE
jgi:hypothetical protein